MKKLPEYEQAVPTRAAREAGIAGGSGREHSSTWKRFLCVNFLQGIIALHGLNFKQVDSWVTLQLRPRPAECRM